MENRLERLETEARRIIESPYPTQLQTLHDILNTCDVSTIETWSSCFPCQIASLVSEVLSALPHWDYCLDVITQLANVQLIRDTIMTAEPTLLHWAVEHSLQEFSPKSKYVKLVEALLHHALPEKIALPSNVQILLQRFFDLAVGQSSLSNVIRLELLLEGACRDISRSLSSEILSTFESQTLQMLRDRPDPEQQAVGLSCLAIMAHLLQKTGISTPQPRGSTQMESFFSDPKAQKTMQLVVLQVLTACSSSTGEDLECKIQQCQSAITVVGAIEENARAEYCSRNPVMIKKLHEKVLQSACPEPVQMLMLAFVARLSPSSAFSPALSSLYERLLFGKDVAGISSVRSCDIVAVALPNYLRYGSSRSSHSKESRHVAKRTRVTTAIMSMIADISRSIQDYESVRRIEKLEAALQAVHQLKEEGALDVVEFGSDDLATAEIFVRDIIRIRQRSRKLESCSEIAFVQRLSDLGRSVSEVLLRLALSEGHERAQLPSTLITGLLEMHRGAQQTIVCSRHSRPMSRSTAELFQHEGHAIDHSISWRNSLRSIVLAKTKQDERSLTGLISSICADLEQRCATVEEPLRQERQKVADYESRYSELEDAYGQLESSMIDQELHASDLQSRIEVVSHELKTSQTETAHLQKQLLNRDDQTAKAKEEHEAAVSKLEGLLIDLRRKLEGTAVTHEEQMKVADASAEELTRELASLRVRLKEERNKVNEASIAIDGILQEKAQLGEKHANIAEELKEAKGELAATKVDIHRLGDTVTRQAEMITKVEASKELLQRSMQELKSSLERDKESFVLEYRDSAAQAKNEWEREKRSLQGDLARLRSDRDETETRHKDAMIEADEQLAHQKRKGEKLQRHCAKLEAEVSEVQELRHRLMSAIGLPLMSATTELVHPVLPIRSASSTAQTPARQARSPEAKATMRGGAEELGTSLISFEQERTPKRSRPRKSFKVPALAPPDTSRRCSVRSAQRDSVVHRRPLSETSVNSSPQKRPSPTKVAIKVVPRPSSTEDDENDDMDRWSFMDGVVEGTPGTALGEPLDDDTTVDV